MFPRLIGFTGGAGHGKTTAARAVVADFRRGPSYHRISFADPLRTMLLAIGLTLDEMTDGEKKEAPHPLLGGRSPRYALQTLGTDWGRRLVCDDLWLRVAAHRALNLVAAGAGVVFDDVRFDNEAALIREHGGIVVRVEHLGRPSIAPGLRHASERGVDPALIDHAIAAADVVDLRTKLFALLNSYA